MAKSTKKNSREIKEMTESELAKKLSALREDVRVMSFKSEGSRSKNVKELGSLKKQIARVLTRINEAKAAHK
jgi:ribosomal protein L29